LAAAHKNPNYGDGKQERFVFHIYSATVDGVSRVAGSTGWCGTANQYINAMTSNDQNAKRHPSARDFWRLY
jgi:hypothetical protein